MKRFLLLVFTLLRCLICDAQRASFLIPSHVCLEQVIELENKSTGSTNFQWDFCFNNLEGINFNLDVYKAAELSYPEGLELIFDQGSWHGFATGRDNRKLIRLDFGSDLESTPVVTDLGSLGGILNGPRNIRLIKEGDNWYGIIGSWSNGSLTRLSFGNSLASTPTAEVIGNLGGWSQIRGLEINKYQDSVIVILSSYGNNFVSIVNFGLSITNMPNPVTDVHHIGKGSPLIKQPMGISLQKYNGNWFGLLSSKQINKVIYLEFGEDLFSEPLIEELGSVTFPTDLYFQKDGLDYYAIVATRSSGVFHYHFGQELNSINNTVTFQSSGSVGTSDVFAYAIAKESPIWRGLAIGQNNKQIVLNTFLDNCNTYIPESSTDFQPTDISYSSPGSYPIELTAFSSNGNFDTYVDTVVVRDAISPTISFSTSNACISNENSFSATSSDDTSITTWNWDFGDNSGTVSGQTATHKYMDTGVFKVTLEAQTTDGCVSSYEDSLAIYYPPISDFDVTSNSICTNSLITFQNTSNTINSDSAVFTWNYNDEVIETSLNGKYTFTTEGDKSIKLVSEITGCKDSIQKIITLNEGPLGAFEWSNNCFGDSVHFINNSETKNVSYNWDFGDSSTISNLFEPNHLFTSPGKYSVSLGVLDLENSCITKVSDTIIISDEPLADFTYDTPIIENIPNIYAGIDNSILPDSITSWFWTVEEYYSFEGEQIEFSIPHVDTIRLIAQYSTLQGCSGQIVDTLFIEQAKEPEVSFKVNDEACLFEDLDFSNESINAISQTWDFCFNNLEGINFNLDVYKATELSYPEGLELIFDQGSWHGFATGRDNRKLIRLDFGSDLESTPVVTDLGSLGGILNGPRNIRLIKEGDNWYGIIGSWSNGSLTRLSFGNSLASTPTAEVIGNLGGWSQIRGLEINKYQDSVIVILSSYGNNFVSIVNFGLSITNMPNPVTDVHHIGKGSPLIKQPMGISLQKYNGNWFGLLSSKQINKVIYLEFGEDLFSEPLIEELGSVTFPTDLYFQKDGLDYYAIVATRSSGVFHYHFGQELNSINNTVTFQSSGSVGTSDVFAYAIAKESPIWRGLAIGQNNKQIVLNTFLDNCNTYIPESSTDFQPTDISYSSPGSYPIELTAFSSNGNFDTYVDTVVVRDAISPTISFSTSNACISNENSFSATSSDDPSITTWNWDFGDGTGTASGQSVEYQYANAGTFDVGLAIDAENGCSNSASKKIHIYNPPNPSFSYTSGVTCSNSPLDFVNSTAFNGPDSLLSFQWNMNDEMLLDDSDPSYIFKTGGEKNVTLTANIPGCNNVASELIDITPGPETAFTFQGSCEQESFTFSNATTGNGITGYRWDFGDGYTSTVPSPIHRFESAGSFPVSLTASNELGCNTTLQQVVAAQFLPVPNFTNDLACSDKEVTFYDQSSVSNANIIDSQWRLSNSSIGYSQQASGPSPTFQAEAEGQYRLRLIVESNYGCVDTLIRDDVTVNPSPTADFVFSNTCFGDETLFSEAAMLPPDTDINTVDWLINDNLFTANEVTYQFLTPGSYPVEMFVRASNFCTDNTSKTIDINPLPTLDILVTDSCESYPVSINATVDSPLDPVESYAWMIDEKLISSLDGFSYVFDSPGIYEIALAVATRNNCTNSSTKTIDIHPIPNSGFEVFPSIGASPLNVAFTDRSSGAKSVIYDFSIYNDDVSADDNTRYIYTDVRKDWPQQIAFNDFGCTDTSFVEIEAVIPIYDIAMARATTETGGAGLQMSFELINNGTIIINNPVVKIDLGDNASLNHPLTGRIMPGENRRFDVDFEVLNANKGIRYICFEAPTVLGSYEDVNPYDNANCVSIEQSFSVFDPYPNPSQGQFFLPIVLPETASCELSVFGEKGELVWQRNFQNAKKGLNLFQINASNYGQGVFLLNIRYKGIETTKKILLR
jgi:PKD repeat protein